MGQFSDYLSGKRLWYLICSAMVSTWDQNIKTSPHYHTKATHDKENLLLSPQRTLTLVQGKSELPLALPASTCLGSPVHSPTGHWREPSGSTNLLGEGGSQGASEQWEQVCKSWLSWSLPGKVSAQICNYLTQARVKRKGGRRQERSLTVSKDNLLYRRYWENLHSQFTCVTCLQGVNCSWHLTRRQHLPWTFAMKLPLFQVKLLCHYCWVT